MAKIEVYNQEAAPVKEIELNDDVFGIEPNQQAIYDAVLVYLAGLRQGTHATKTRAFVSGTGKKPFRQKGTGRARQGSTRATQWRGGAIAFGPQLSSGSIGIEPANSWSIERDPRCSCSCPHCCPHHTFGGDERLSRELRDCKLVEEPSTIDLTFVRAFVIR